jgi:mRNA-degrading endonuclease RelE of RelBE toxin-antitoxin system
VKRRLRRSPGFELPKGNAFLTLSRDKLAHEPAEESNRKKMLSGLVPPSKQVRPAWQLRGGDLRVFYDVDESSRVVIVRAVRRKKRKKTEEIL